MFLHFSFVLADIWPCVVDRYVARAFRPSANSKTYQSIYLRESYRDGHHVRKRNIANLTHCEPPQRLRHRAGPPVQEQPSRLGSRENPTVPEGLSVGAVWTVSEPAPRLGLHQALGSDFAGQLPVASGSAGSGAGLAPVRGLAGTSACGLRCARHPPCFDQNDLYANLSWLNEHQPAIEDRLFAARGRQQKPELFLYDVTSSYLEGEENAYAAYGYNCDGKKKQETDCYRSVVRRRRRATNHHPGPTSQSLLQALDIHIPEALPHTETLLVTRKKTARPERDKPR